MRISDWSSDVCSSDLQDRHAFRHPQTGWRHSRGILERPVTAHEKFSESPRSRHYPLSSTPCRGIRHRGGSPMNIHPIRTEADYKAALREMSAYFDNEPEPGSEEGDRFALLITLEAAYEIRHSPLPSPAPLETKEDRALEQ